jgi:prepilin-type N-terminal cleavage/methylation domain-containing protein
MRTRKSQLGFTLLEMVVAVSIGLLALAVMTSLFKTGMDTTTRITQRAEVQQNLRAAIELMSKDISLAGAGLPNGGLQLTTAGGLSRFACNQAGLCYIPGGTYPNSQSGAANYMYPIETGFGTGVEGGLLIPTAKAEVNSSITVVYCDQNFPLSNFSFALPAAGTAVNVGVLNAANQPNNLLAPGGVQIGDAILFTVATPGNGTGATGNSLVQNAAVVAEVTGNGPYAGALPNCTPTACQWTLAFAPADTLNFNQTTGNNNLAAVATAAGGANAQTSACRLRIVSYFLEVPPAGVTVQTPRLMRQVNGLTAVPVADNIINLQFTYDVINSVAGTIDANVQNPLAVGDAPSLIQKVNIWVMGSSLLSDGNRSQSLFLATSVATSNMSFCNSYSYQAKVCQ